MKKIILVDGNNLLFRSFYATAYSGNMMRNSKGFPTNALYGFTTMIQKIIHEENPDYMAVAFDVGKNFRAQKYAFYKDGRKETPQDLILQMPYARKLLKAMKIPYFELEPYEADDIIGTLARMVEEDRNFVGTIVSSDHDLLQLISDQIDMKLLKQKGHILYNKETFYLDYGIEPIRVIDLKGLSGDSSDNIPGVKGVGEKTALGLLQKFDSVEGVYEHIEEVKGKLREKLENDKESAFMSKEIATIYKEVPLEIQNLEELKIDLQESDELYNVYEELEFYSLLKNFSHETNREKFVEEIVLSSLDDFEVENEVALYIEVDGTNYHTASILGMGVSDANHTYYVKPELIHGVIEKIRHCTLYTFDLKKDLVLLHRLGTNLETVNFDLMIATYLLDYTIKDDISYLMIPDGYKVKLYEDALASHFSDEEATRKDICLKSKYILDTRDKYILDLKREEQYDLFTSIEMPLIYVLASMEIEGVKVDSDVLEEMKKEIKVKIEGLTKEIYELAGEEFNIASPKQLGEILFVKFGLPGGQRTTKGYKTDVKVMHKLRGMHPIIDKVLEYRNLTKLYSTYLEGLQNFILEDGKIHTIFKQNVARTGRLSSIEPNLQNIPVRDEEGRKIRKAFFPTKDLFYSADYSQIELRILAHVSKSKELQEAFIHGDDIHTKVASDIYGVDASEVTKTMRSTAKAVIFGIVYGISGFGLGENLEISSREGKEFIDKYYELYPGVKRYMDSCIQEAYETGVVRTLFGRKRKIEELNSANYMVRSQGERIALNTPIQGTSADIIKKAMVKIYAAFKENQIQSKMVLQVHDELIFDLVEEEKEKVHQIVSETMENVVTLDVPLKVSADYGVTWYDTK